MPAKYPPGFPWNAQFRRNSWWKSPAKGRIFVIVGTWHDDAGALQSVDLLEHKKEVAETVPVADLIDWLNKGMIEPASSMPW